MWCVWVCRCQSSSVSNIQFLYYLFSLGLFVVLKIRKWISCVNVWIGSNVRNGKTYTHTHTYSAEWMNNRISVDFICEHMSTQSKIRYTYAQRWKPFFIFNFIEIYAWNTETWSPSGPEISSVQISGKAHKTYRRRIHFRLVDGTFGLWRFEAATAA